MKKLLSLILVTVLCVLALASCDTVKGWFDKGEGNGDGGDVIEYNLPGAVEYLRTMYINGDTVTPNDYELVAQVMIKAVKYTVDWSVDNDKVKLTKGETKWTVDVDNFAEEAHDYTLTATITAGDGTKDSTLTFARQVPKYEVLTYEQFLAVEDGQAVTVNGIVTGIVETSKENDLYIQDENGGYFIYAMEALPSELGLKIGMKVSVTGIRDTYYDLPQVKEPVVTIMDSTINPVEPIDITEAFAAAEENVDSNFSQYFSMLVTLKGVKVLGQDTSNDSYYNFSLAGKQSYVRISSSTCMLNADDITAFQNNVAANINNNADVVGIVSNYGGKIYLVPVTKDAYYNFETVIATNEEKVDYELGQITFSNVTEDGAITVPVKGEFYTDVVISWAADNDCAVVDNTAGTITFTRPESAVTIKLTVTATSGDVTKTKEISVDVDGSVFDGTVNLTKENMGLGGYAAGEVTVESVKLGYTELGGYDNGIQMRKNSSDASKFSTIFNVNALPYGIKKIVFVYNTAKTPRLEDMLSISFGNDANVSAYTAKLTGVEGQMTYEIVPDVATYTFFKIAHTASGSLYFDEINIVLDKPIEAHTCEFSTATCTKKATCSICGETTGDFAPHAYNEETHQCVCEKYNPDWLAIAEEMTIAEALAAPKDKKVIISGVVVGIYKEWDTQYENMSVYLADSADSETKIIVFQTPYLLAEGDIIKVTGIIGQYNNVNQIAKGSTVEKICQHANMSAATCTAPKTCPDCNYTEGEALPHNFGENGDAADCQNEGCDVLNPAIHVCGEFVFVETVAPTCTTVGYDIYGCPDETCPLTEQRNEKPALTHNYVNGVCDRVGCGEKDPDYYAPMSIVEANAAADGTKVQVTGTVSVVNTPWSEQHGNITVTIVDEDLNALYVYRLKTNVTVGDVIVLKGVVGNHQGNKQIAAGATAEIIDHVDPPIQAEEVTVSEAIDLAEGTLIKVTATVVKIDSAWDATNKRMNITISDGEKTLYVYRIYTQVALGDVITIEGVMGSYQGNKQIAEGATATIDVAHVCSEYTKADCLNAAKCVVCGVANGEALGHDFQGADCTTKGVCSVCQAEGAALGHLDENDDKVCDRCTAAMGDAPVESDPVTVKAEYTGGVTGNLKDNVANHATTLNLDADLFTVTTNKGSANEVGYNKDNDFRLYFNASGSNKITFDMDDGYTIKSIVITFTSASYGKACQVSAGDSVITTTSASGVASVTVDINANSFELYNANTSNNQVRIKSIAITYVSVQ